nr:hypothetical protein [Tanacetum cinerariifolium]
MKIDQHPFNAESDLIESTPNHDSSIIISLKIDSLFDEFAGELTLLKSIPSRIDEIDCHPEKETRFTKRLLVTLLCPVSHIAKDFVKRLRSTLGEEGDHYMEPTEFEIQEMVNILVSGEAY